MTLSDVTVRTLGLGGAAACLGHDRPLEVPSRDSNEADRSDSGGRAGTMN
jgi:hypothetical protein